MKTSIKRMSLMLIVLAFAIPAWADIPRDPSRKPPPPTSSEKVKMEIRSDRYATEAHLRIPRSMLKQFTAIADTDSGLNPSRMYVVVAGIFLSLSIMVGGVMLFRYRKTDRVKTVAAAILVLIAASAVVVSANAPPPRRSNPEALKLSIPGQTVSGNVRVEVVSEGDQIILIVPAN